MTLIKDAVSQVVLSLRGARAKLATGAALLLSAAICYHVLFGPNGAMIYKKKKDEYRQLQTDIQKLTQDNNQLADRVKALKTDPKAIEREARESMHYARPGEIIYTEPNPEEPGSRNQESEARSQK